jgi:amino acid transporter
VAEPKPVFLRDATGLVRQISSFRALVFNIMYIWPTGMFVFLAAGQGIFPGANLITASLVTLPLILVIAFLYAQLASAFPRSGGDYVFAGRILHPSLGFVINFVVVVVNISIVGVASTWVVSLGLGPMLAGLGTITHESGYLGMASALTTQSNEFAIGAILCVVLPIILFFGTDLAFRIQTAFFAVAILSLVAVIGTMFVLPSSTFASNFNALSGSSVSSVIGAAQGAGANLSITWNETLLAIVYTMLSVWGFTFSSYVGGEVKNASRSQFVSMLGSAVVYAGFMILLMVGAYAFMGHDFLASINYLSLTANPAYTLPVATPTISFLAGLGADNAPILLLGGIGLLAGIAMIIGIVDPFWIIRCLFAWSFDRLIPSSFAKVHERYRVPYVSLVAIIILDVIFAYLAVYTPFSSFLTYNVTASFIGAAVVGIAAIAFPWRRRDLFSASPSIVTRRVGGVPLVSIFGVAVAVISLLVAYGSLLPAISGTFNPLYVSFTTAFFLVGFVIYFLGYFFQRSRGVPIDRVLAEIPPE